MSLRLPTVGSTDLWLVDLDAPLLPGDALCLSAEEEARAARFRFPRDRHRYLQAHIALRKALADIVAVPPDALAFSAGVAGKPHLPGYPACRFNLSHSGHHGLVAVNRSHEIGVDIESRRPIDDWAALADQHFSHAERVAMLDGIDSNTAFLHGWTRKEACLKAIGTGLDRDLREVVTGCSSALRTVMLDVNGTAAPVVVESFVGRQNFVAAVAHVVTAAQAP